ncbi:BTAD domain-containing putative transcriptional regulator [Streptomyces purpureus]|uniref:BTAD domain-containing putative transcriptional regulator n=1 Tax=Streptomyces purpureus TaxID=1951 RepID=UPI00036DF969|nr:BTAD domain-containing putative transcriptional regulator [Streptomyces purpureus]
MHFSVLGTTQALHDDGTPQPVGGPRLRALLAVLALRAGRGVGVDVLVDEVWGGEPPEDAVGALQALVGRLRRVLGRDAVVSVPGGYRLGADRDAVDLHRFDRLVTEGVRAADGEPGRALGILDEALGLWRDPVLADLPDRAAEAARWEARRLAALRARLAALLALGRAEEALPELAALATEFPLDEPVQALHIRALRASGRQAEALQAYEDVRTALADRLGTDPGPELRSLHTQLLRPEPAPAPRSTPRPGNLRARLTSFVGREEDIARIRDDLGRARLVTLLGPGGAGKTRLSQEAAERAAGGWEDGVWLVELAPVTDPDALPEAVLGALGARETVLRGAGAEELRAAGGTADPLRRLVQHCAGRRMLLLLDNCEHVVHAAAVLAEELLARCPDLTVLATSREPLGVPGELLRPVDPLPDPMALRLLAERGAAARPGFDPADDADACAEICRRLDGLPLAIELAAARLRLLTPRQLADRLDDRFRLLTSGARTVLPRQQTLRAVVDWSWDLLGDAERTVLRRLSVFSGGCDPAAAEAVCAEPDTLTLLGALVDKSLVVADPTGGDGMRYRLLETVAEYGAERLDEAGDRAATERRHLVHYRELARTTDPQLRGGGQVRAIARLSTEYENLRTALRRAVARQDEDEALVLVHSLLTYWQLRDLRADARHWAERTAALGPDPFAPPAAPVVPLTRRCTDAPPPLDEDVRWEARRGVRLIEIASMDHESALWTSPAGLARLREISAVYRPGLPQTCRHPGFLHFYAVLLTASPEAVRDMLDGTVDACREYGYDWELACALNVRANVMANRAGWAGDSARDADEALEIFMRLDDAWGAAEALSSRGEAREQRCDYEGAAEDFATAIGYAERMGAQAQMALLRARYGEALTATGRGEEGEAILREVMAGGRGSGSEALYAAQIYLSVWLGRTGRTAEAREQMTELRARFRSQTMSIFDGITLGILAWLENLDGRHAEALDMSVRAFERSREPLSLMVAPHMPSAQLVTAAWALAGLGGASARTAAVLLGAQAALLPPGHVVAPLEREHAAMAEKLTRGALGDDAVFAAAYAEGGGLSLEEAAALLADQDQRVGT